jgi:hypothetical protein
LATDVKEVSRMGIIIDWVIGKLDAIQARTEPLDTSRDPPPVVSYRFRVTAAAPEAPVNPSAPEKPPSVYYVYGRDEREALQHLPESVVIVRVEPAGHVEDGILHFTPDEQCTVIVENRAAPGG